MNLDRLARAAEDACRGRPPAHDYHHVERVARTARTIAEREGANVAVVVAAALLHELVNLPKDHPESHRSGDLCAEAADRLLDGEPTELRAAIVECIRDHAFSKGAAPRTIEVAVLQDADRLDALGAIGIARCFATCSEMGRPLFSPIDPLCVSRAPDDKRWGLDHFFRKLLRIELHTETARELAAPRQAFLRAYLEALSRELA